MLMKNVFSDIDQIRGMMDMRECKFLNRLAGKVIGDFGEKSVFCEIGSFCGKSTVSIAKALVKHASGVLYAIDWHQGASTSLGLEEEEYVSTYGEYLRNLEKFEVEERIKTIKKRSEDSVNDVPDQIHFLWIDGCHDYKNVKLDYCNYEGMVAPGGFLLFHDACWTSWEGPFRLIEEEVLYGMDYNFYAMIGNIMVFRKEANTMNKVSMSALCALCKCVSGKNRPWHRKIVSAIFFRLTAYYTILFHNWSK